MTKKSQRRTRSSSRETEAALLIWSDSPKAFARKIARLASISDYRLLTRDPQAIHDVYFDTPARALQAQKLALRVRRVGRSSWITLKGPGPSTDWGGVDRLEIEAAWSEDALARVIKELADRGIELRQPHEDLGDAPPLDVMRSMGLEVIQNRRDRRRVRNIVPVEEGLVANDEDDGPVLAELAIDAVVYHFSGQDVRLYELEVEAKIRRGSRVLRDVIAGLVARYGPALRRWRYGKLVTGRAIEELLSEGALEGLMDDGGHLKPVALDKIDDHLRSGGV